jgi:hypothetical protein
VQQPQLCRPDYIVHSWQDLERVLLDLEGRAATDAEQPYATLEPAADS